MVIKNIEFSPPKLTSVLNIPDWGGLFSLKPLGCPKHINHAANCSNGQYKKAGLFLELILQY